jgi:5-methylcytosine-specific restriction endonuclease McrA
LEEFYRHKPSAEGHVRSCKNCYRLRERERYATNPESAEAQKQRVKRYLKANPEKRRAWTRKSVPIYHARRRKNYVEDVDPLLVLVLSGGECGICGQVIDGPFHVDHIIPVSRNGEHSYGNVQAAHPLCNCRKHNRLDFTLL